MRIRSIKPEFWRSEDIEQLEWRERLVFIGLWSYVDDNGVGIDRLANIAADLFASDLSRDARECLARVGAALDKLAGLGLITRYGVAGKKYLFVTGWDRHQKIDRPSRGGCYPRPGLTSTETPTPPQPQQPSRHTRDGLDAGAGEQGSRGTGEQGKEQGAPPRTRTPQGTRIPDDFTVTAEMREWAATEVDGLDVDRSTQKFIDYWKGVSGAKAVKRDWTATWRNWLRSDFDRNGVPANVRTLPARSTTDDRVVDHFRLAERLGAEPPQIGVAR